MVFEHDYKNFPELTNSQIEEFGIRSPHKQITEDFTAEVIKVHDGDTITLRTSFRDFDFPLRLAGIDAPELNAGGEVARDWLKKRIEGDNVLILIDQDNRVEKWGRLLGQVLHGGLDISQTEVDLNLAVPFEERGDEIDDIKKILSLEKFIK